MRSLTEILTDLHAQKGLMIAVSTGGPRIQDKNGEYQDRRIRILADLSEKRLEDPNPYPDLWAWYGKWSGGDLPTYRSRRAYISELYQPLIDHFAIEDVAAKSQPLPQTTGWTRVDRQLDAIQSALAKAGVEEDFQTVGLLCREVLISLAQAVFDGSKHKSEDGVTISPTDADRMLTAYFSHELQGGTNQEARSHAKASHAFAKALQHRRTATFRDAALCAEASRTVVNIVAIISGKRDPGGAEIDPFS